MNVIPAELASVLRRAQRVAVLTGAGISAESGVPTFRDAQTGLWARFNPADLATPEAFENDPRLVWDWYQHRRALCAAAEPNAGHRALVQLEQLFPEFLLTTQNIDGLHERAGSQKILRLHGCVHHYKCSRSHEPWEGEPPATEEPPPRHPRTGHYLRPDVVWFGESLPAAALEQSIEAARQADVYFTIGTSAQVYPAADLPVIAAQHDAVTVEINPDATSFSAKASYSLRGKAGEILPALLEALSRV